MMHVNTCCRPGRLREASAWRRNVWTPVETVNGTPFQVP